MPNNSNIHYTLNLNYKLEFTYIYEMFNTNLSAIYKHMIHRLYLS